MRKPIDKRREYSTRTDWWQFQELIGQSAAAGLIHKPHYQRVTYGAK